MNQAITAPTEILIAALFPSRYDSHVQAWRWRQFTGDRDADIAARQAAKRAAGIGSEGLCHA